MERKKELTTKKVPADIAPYEGNYSGMKAKVSVNQYDFNGHYLKTFESQREAAKELKIGTSAISNASSGRIKSAGHFMWKKA